VLSTGSFLKSGFFAVSVLFVMSANAQTIPLSANLATSSSTPESAVAAEMSGICSRLGGIGSRTRTPDQVQLFSVCTELGNASNDFSERVTGLVAISAKTATAQWELRWGIKVICWCNV